LLNAFDELRGLSADGEKRLRVGMSVDPLLCYLPQVLEGFNRRYPHTRVTVVEDGPEGLLARLRNCELDLAVSSLNGAAGGADLAMQALKSERFSLYQGGDLTAAGQPPAEAKWVVPRSCSVGACRHPRDRRTLYAARPDRRDRLLSGDLVPGQAARLYRTAERSGGRTLRPAAAPAENPDAGDRHQRALLRLYPP
jgi:DNA-binding transcriptional LysR family regulator